MPETNMTATVRNIPGPEAFNISVDLLKGFMRTVEKIKGDSNYLTPEQEKILFRLPCKEIPLLYDACVSVAKGDDINLVAINEANLSLALYILQMYDSSSKTLPENLQIFYYGVQQFSNLVLVTASILLALYQATKKSFAENTEAIESQALSFIFIGIAILIIGAFFLWFKVIRVIFKWDMRERNVLHLIPTKLMLSNKYLHRYLFADSQGMLSDLSYTG